MRPKKNQKSIQKNAALVLQEESGKIQQKLQELRQQVQKKKKQQLNRNSQNINVNGFLKGKPNITYSSQSSFLSLLSEIKLQAFQSVFKQKCITRVQQIISLTDSQIDELKQLPVGYRIKLRKFLKEKNGERNISADKRNLQEENLSVNSRQIQEIIKDRGPKRFVPLQDYNEQQLCNELGQQQQEQMIKSLINAFNPRPGIIKKISQKPSLKNVHWSQQVDQMQQVYQKKHEGQHQKYPKEICPKLIGQQNKSDRKYCWNCFHIINKEKMIEIEQHQYCSQKCKNQYNQKIIEVPKIVNRKAEQKQEIDLQQNQVQFVDLSF